MTKEQFSVQILAVEQSLYRVAKSLLKNDDDCADAIQNAILKAYGKLHTLKHEKYFKTWVTRIVINESYAILRENKRNQRFFTDEFIHLAQISQVEETAAEERLYSPVFEEITKIKETWRIPFVLHYVEGYSIAEIAKMLSLSEGTVKTRLYRARNRLKERLKGVAGYEKMEF